MSVQPLKAHSVAEAYLYLMATPCAECHQGPLDGTHQSPQELGDGRWELSVRAQCRKCGNRQDLHFETPEPVVGSINAPPVVNDTDKPSRIIDVGQWILLFRMIADAAGRETSKQESRRLGLEAAMCLEEALKFYDDPANDLPPDDAFFCDTSRDRFTAHPEQFSRQRLLNHRSMLPSESSMRRVLERGTRLRCKPWWQFWKRS